MFHNVNNPLKNHRDLLQKKTITARTIITNFVYQIKYSPRQVAYISVSHPAGELNSPRSSGQWKVTSIRGLTHGECCCHDKNVMCDHRGHGTLCLRVSLCIYLCWFECVRAYSLSVCQWRKYSKSCSTLSKSKQEFTAFILRRRRFDLTTAMFMW